MSAREVKERPILFNHDMVNAILFGRKTQTRRIVKRTDTGRVKAVGSPMNWHIDDPESIRACPFGQIGDRLWVRETWRVDGLAGRDALRLGDCETTRDSLSYFADCSADPALADGPWVPSIHMPRWASRLQLEITALRKERLHDISGRSAWAEGCPYHPATDPECATIISWYMDLWVSIYGLESWRSNPWVWVVEFGRVET